MALPEEENKENLSLAGFLGVEKKQESVEREPCNVKRLVKRY